MVFDFIEEFRPQAVDRVVFSLISKSRNNLTTDVNQLTNKTRYLLADKITERMNRTETFRKKEMRFEEVIMTQATTLANVINGNEKTYKPYIAKW